MLVMMIDKFKGVRMTEFREVSAGSGDSENEINYIKPAELTTLEGTFLEVQNSEFGPSYKFELEDGSISVVNGCGALNKKMQKVEVGALVRLENLGKKPITTGALAGKSFHDIKVLTA